MKQEYDNKDIGDAIDKSWKAGIKEGRRLQKQEIKKLLDQYFKKSSKMMDQSSEHDEQEIFTFWDGFNNAISNLLRDIK